MFRMLYMWSGNNNVEYYTVYSVLGSCLCMWNHLWNSCQNISMKMRLCIWCIVLFMEKLVLMFGDSFVCLSKIPRAFLYSIVLMRRIMLLLRRLQALATPILKRCLHGFCNGLCLVGVPNSHCCVSSVSFWAVMDWQVWQAHTPPENALCQVFTLLQQLWCLHPSLLPPWVHTAWVPWTWGLYLEASTLLAHVEPWWGGDWKRKTSKAHVSEIVASVLWPGENVVRLESLIYRSLWEEYLEPTWSGRC